MKSHWMLSGETFEIHIDTYRIKTDTKIVDLFIICSFYITWVQSIGPFWSVYFILWNQFIICSFYSNCLPVDSFWSVHFIFLFFPQTAELELFYPRVGRMVKHWKISMLILYVLSTLNSLSRTDLSSLMCVYLFMNNSMPCF